MIDTILWDVDGTLLDFKAAEKAAMKSLFREFALGECTDPMVRRYSAINDGLWKQLERGEISKRQVQLSRFEIFFGEIGADPGLAEQYNEKYQVRLGDTIVLKDHCLDLIRSLRGKVRQYVVSNGTVIAQSKKLRLSGLGAEMDGIFLSEEVGTEKPGAAFFDRVFEQIGEERRRTAVIVGDSLTSDIRGGMNAGIRTCWYNPEGALLPEGYRADYTIRNLQEIRSLFEENRIFHPFPPLFDEHSRVLVLGSFPSVKSRENLFFYGHPQNRFWRVIAAVFGERTPETIPEKKRLILGNHLALWDSIASCEVTGSVDASIRGAIPNDLRVILDHAPIERIFCNGRKSYEIYTRLIEPRTARGAECLPSTSPANAQWTTEKLTEAWSVLKRV